MALDGKAVLADHVLEHRVSRPGLLGEVLHIQGKLHLLTWLHVQDALIVEELGLLWLELGVGRLFGDTLHEVKIRIGACSDDLAAGTDIELRVVKAKLTQIRLDLFFLLELLVNLSLRDVKLLSSLGVLLFLLRCLLLVLEVLGV